MRQFFRMLLLALVLMTVALISALTAMQLAIHGREVAIPSLIGLTPVEAERAGAASGLQVVVERQFYSFEVPEGRIVTQAPPAGAKVRRGWSIRVAQSLGSQKVTIPDLTGGSARIAELNLRRRGLSLGAVAHVNLPQAPADQVISQSPVANASGVSAPKISLLVSDGPEPATYVMPNLVGQLLGSATAALQDASLKLGKVSLMPAQSAAQVEASPTPPPVSQPNPSSVIVTQTPAPGLKIVAGSVVNLEVR